MTSSQIGDCVVAIEEQRLSRELYQAIINDDKLDDQLESVERLILEYGKEAVFTARLVTHSRVTLLLLTINRRKKLPIIEGLVDLMPPELLTQTDDSDNTALHLAAMNEKNLEAAKLLVTKNHELLNFVNKDGFMPIQLAAKLEQEKMTRYLLTVGMRDEIHSTRLKDATVGAKVMQSLVSARFYDLARELLKLNPDLAWEGGISPLEPMTRFPSGFSHLKFKCHMSILHYVIYVIFMTVVRKFLLPFWNVRTQKQLQSEASKVVEDICSCIKNSENDRAFSTLKKPFLLAARNGLETIFSSILFHYPAAIHFVDEENHSVFHLAVMYRRENIFKVAYKRNIEGYKMFLSAPDNEGNNVLHLAGYRSHQDRLDQSPTAILQMQHELKWFKELEKLVSLQDIKLKNNLGKTPVSVFNEEHVDMAAKEIHWMTGMASACSVAAPLIATVAFAAAITVPGGNNRNGLPLFSNTKSFRVFAILDALALFASITCVLSFLSIFTSRYGVDDFLYALPNRVIIGLISLFISAISLMVAFGATLFLVFGQNNSLTLMPIIAFASAPLILYTFLQLPPLLNMMKSTYGQKLLV